MKWTGRSGEAPWNDGDRCRCLSRHRKHLNSWQHFALTDSTYQFYLVAKLLIKIGILCFLIPWYLCTQTELDSAYWSHWHSVSWRESLRKSASRRVWEYRQFTQKCYCISLLSKYVLTTTKKTHYPIIWIFKVVFNRETRNLSWNRQEVQLPLESDLIFSSSKLYLLKTTRFLLVKGHPRKLKK